MQFDYRIRPNKATERRMLAETFRHLSSFKPIEDYRYIGFGSTTFTDFILFHKELNICDMVSIEKNRDLRKRFDFNRPFHCVRIEYGNSNQVLPRLTWDKPVIAWLDYDGQLTKSVMRDVNYVTSRAMSGSMLIVTVNAEGYRTKPSEDIEEANRRLRQRFEQQRGILLPPRYKSKHLQGISMAKTCRDLIHENIVSVLQSRNGSSTGETSMHFRSLLNLVYKDGARMLTFGVIFYQENEEDILSECHFGDLEFTYREDGKLYEIKVPVMTPRERHYLERLLPAGPCDQALEIGLSQEEIDSYIRLYRYCPSYAEVELT